MPSNLATSQGTVEWNRSGTQKEEPELESEPERDQRVMLATGKETLVRERGETGRVLLRGLGKPYSAIGPPSTHLTDKWELASPYVVTIQPKGEDSS